MRRRRNGLLRGGGEHRRAGGGDGAPLDELHGEVERRLPAEGGQHRVGLLPIDDAAEDVDVDADWQMIQGTANIVFAFNRSEESKFHLYLIGGVGGYNVKAVGDDVEGSDSDTNFGVNAGAGFDFGLGNLAAFVEGRYHAVFSGTVDPETLDDATASFVPITIGIRFGGGS